MREREKLFAKYKSPQAVEVKEVGFRMANTLGKVAEAGQDRMVWMGKSFAFPQFRGRRERLVVKERFGL